MIDFAHNNDILLLVLKGDKNVTKSKAREDTQEA